MTSDNGKGDKSCTHQFSTIVPLLVLILLLLPLTFDGHHPWSSSFPVRYPPSIYPSDIDGATSAHNLCPTSCVLLLLLLVHFPNTRPQRLTLSFHPPRMTWYDCDSYHPVSREYQFPWVVHIKWPIRGRSAREGDIKIYESLQIFKY